MRKFFLIAASCLSVLIISAVAQAQTIVGDYVETRSADVWTGPCVANGEVNLTGDQAILAWRVTRGTWNGVALDGLSVVGVVKAGATLGDPYTNPYPAKAVMIVDQKADCDQQQALVSFAQKMAGELLRNVVRVEVAPIKIEVTHDGGHYGKVTMRAGNLAGIETRNITDRDHLCGNEETFYPPLTRVSDPMVAFTEIASYQGTGLNLTFQATSQRSAFIGTFAD